MTALLTCTWMAAMPAAGEPARAGQHAQRIAAGAPGGADLRYWLHVPAAALTEPTRRWPLLIFLHGSGERGTDMELVKVHGPPKHAARGDDLPYFVASPQLPEGESWRSEHVMPMLDALLRDWPIDPARIYLTGLSLGGEGTWRIAAEHPHRFAAIAPVCGWFDPERACTLRDMPVWAFHGDKDDVVPADASRAMVAALQACGGTPRLTIYPGVGHDAWNPAYADPALTDWLFAHRAGPVPSER